VSARLLIRPAAPDDRPRLRLAIVELQEYEHTLHPTRLVGESVADAYLDWMLHKVKAGGAVLVAEDRGHFAGFVAGWMEQAGNIGETADSNRFGLISDICVLPAFRGQRIATRRLDAIGQFLSRTGITRLRVNVLAVNGSARASYENAGFAPYEIFYEKLIETGSSE